MRYRFFIYAKPRLTSVIIIVTLIVVAAALIPSSAVFPQVSASSSSSSSASQFPAPIVISKVDPWAPMRGFEGEKACFADAPINMGAYAWIELHNTTNETLTTSNVFQVEVEPGGSQRIAQSLTLGPDERCLFPTADPFNTRIGVGGSEGNGPPPGAEKGGAAVSITYYLNNTTEDSSSSIAYKDSTPKLSDPYGDTANWQLAGDDNNKDEGENSAPKWVFVDPLAQQRKGDADFNRTTTLTASTDDGSIIMNLTMPERIRSPAVTKFELHFINATTTRLIDNDTLIYEIEYRGSPILNGYQKNQGHTADGKDVKYVLMNKTGSLDLSVKVTALNKEAVGGSFEYFKEPKTANFSITVVPEYPFGILLPILATGIGAMIFVSRRSFVSKTKSNDK